jgi:putative transcriptional regulator
MEKKIKNKIKVYRAINDWTQEELAENIGVTRKTINTIENGVYTPSTYISLKLAKAFNVKVEDLFELNEE